MIDKSKTISILYLRNDLIISPILFCAFLKFIKQIFKNINIYSIIK